MSPILRFLAFILTCHVVTSSSQLPFAQNYTKIPYRGVNLAGTDFGGSFIPGLVPTVDDAIQFGIVGCNAFRFPFKWEHAIVPGTSNVSTAFMTQVLPVVEGLLENGYSVILDLHNYMRYNGSIVTPKQLAAIWQELTNSQSNNSFYELASKYGGQATTINSSAQLMFDLQNEPHDMATEQVLENLNAGIAAVRGNGLQNMVLLEGNGWSGLHAWTSKNGNETANSDVFIPSNIKDSSNRYAINVHQYLDVDSSGTHPECINSTDVVSKINWHPFIQWVQQYKMPVFLTEFGGTNSSTCQSSLAVLLNLMHHSAFNSTSGGFLGWTQWAAGHAWGTKYMYGLNPGDQASILTVSLYAQQNFTTPPECDGGYILGFYNTPSGVSTGYSIQIHNPDWSIKTTVASGSGDSAPGCVCVSKPYITATQAALYDEHGHQYICKEVFGPSSPLLDLSSCAAS